MQKLLKLWNQFLEWLGVNIKKNKDKMISEEQLIGYKQNFTGQTFQWIKTPRPELIGKVVKCRDVEPVGGRVMVIFDDGSQCPANRVSSDLMMIMGEQPPLTMDEVKSINGMNTPKKEEAKPAIDAPHPTVHSGPGVVETPPKAAQPKEEAPAPNIFDAFNSEEIDLSLKLKINLPDKKLLKMMYTSAEDKDKFLADLSSYVVSKINNTVVEQSLSNMLDPKIRKKPSKEETEIKVTEVNDD